MSKKEQQQRRQASTHYHDEARQHQDAAHLSKAGNYEREHQADTAGEQQRQAAHHADEAAKHAASSDGSKK